MDQDFPHSADVGDISHLKKEIIFKELGHHLTNN